MRTTSKILLLAIINSQLAFCEDAATSIGGDIMGRRNQQPYSITDKNINGDDRRNQNAHAEGDSNTGAGIHAVTGALMIAKGVGLIAAGLIAPGAKLVSMGGMELAQSAADRANAKKNGSARELLSVGQANTTQAGAGAAETERALNNPQLNKILEENGVNSEDFKNQLQSGALDSPEAVARAMGITKEITPQDMADAASMVQAEAQAAFRESGALDAIKDAKLGYDEASNTSSAGSFGGSVSTNGMGDSDKRSMLDEKAHRREDGAQGRVANFESVAKGDVKPSSGSLGSSGNPILDFLGGLASGKADAKNADPMLLKSLGILKPGPKQNIFQMAHRNYRSYGKWRKARLRRVAVNE